MGAGSLKAFSRTAVFVMFFLLPPEIAPKLSAPIEENSNKNIVMSLTNGCEYSNHGGNNPPLASIPRRQHAALDSSP